MSRVNTARLKAYTIPETPQGYMGQKKGELGEAIKHLTIQAGDYTDVIDLFGGSAAASLAIPPIQRRNYTYNEKNKLQYNLVKVQADKELSEMLCRSLKKLQNDLSGKQLYVRGVDFKAEIEEAISLKYIDDDEKVKFIIQNNFVDFRQGIYEKGNWKELNYIKKALQKRIKHQVKNVTYQAIFSDEKFTLDEILDAFENLSKIFSKGKLPVYQRDNWRLRNILMTYSYVEPRSLRSLYGACQRTADYEEVKSDFFIEKMSIYERLIMDFQFRRFKYHVYYKNLIEDYYKKGCIELEGKQKIEYAVALFYLREFGTRGGDISASNARGICTRMPNNIGIKIDSTQLKISLKFVRKDWRKKIKNFQQKFKNTRFKCCDFEEIFEELLIRMPDKSYLIYSDSPYIETRAYKGCTFGVKEMEKLIEAFDNPRVKMIFSTRAAIGSKEGQVTTDELRKSNEILMRDEFEAFAWLKQPMMGEKPIEINVLAIERIINPSKRKEKDQGTLAELIRNNKIAEIMITNFEIEGWEDKKKKVRFTVYTYDEFMEILKENMNLPIAGIQRLSREDIMKIRYEEAKKADKKLQKIL